MNGRIALVTGAGSGLGAAIARRLAADGAHLIVNDLNADAAAKVAADVGGEAAPFDVTDSSAFTAAVDGAVTRHGRIDVLVNNAGIVHDRPDVRARSMENVAARMEGKPVEPTGATTGLTDEQWDRMIKTHLYGTFYGTRAALRHMEPARSGSIVNIASIYGIVGSPGTSDYSAAKGAIVLFTKSVGREVAPLGIRVNAVAPGFIDTPLLAPMADMRAMLEMQIPSGRLGQAEEVANLVRFLAGDEASYCFGDVLALTGGYSI
jgi:3-oxoacyl-[acyl-carrier protein] reductase